MGFATGNPEYKVMQTEALKVAKSSPGGSQITPGVLDRIYGNSKIESRYLCVPDFSPSLVSFLFLPRPKILRFWTEIKQKKPFKYI